MIFPDEIWRIIKCYQLGNKYWKIMNKTFPYIECYKYTNTIYIEIRLPFCICHLKLNYKLICMEEYLIKQVWKCLTLWNP